MVDVAQYRVGGAPGLRHSGAPGLRRSGTPAPADLGPPWAPVLRGSRSFVVLGPSWVSPPQWVVVPKVWPGVSWGAGAWWAGVGCLFTCPLEPVMTTTSLPPKPPVPSRAGPVLLSRPDAEALGERIQAQAAVVAAATCEFLLMVGDFDARGGVGWFVGLKSAAHWLSWAWSMSPGAAREHVRAARALPAMPLTVTEFRGGRLSCSKVRESPRVADRVDEQTLVDMARAMTASQLARTISSFRAVDGARLGQDTMRQARWQVREDGMIELRAVLPAEMGAEVVTALELALDRDDHQPPPTDHPAHAAETGTSVEQEEMDPVAEAAEVTTTATLEQRKADAITALARTYLDTEPSDRTGEDRHLVIVEVSAQTLSAQTPTDTQTGAPSSAPTDGVPAGTPTPATPA